MSKVLAQAPSHIFMVRPARFGFNVETGLDNHYQDKSAQSKDWGSVALQEFDSAVMELRKAGVEVCVFQDTEKPEKPDAIFPNNWISCHETGEVILFPMATPNRRTERRQDVVDWISQGFTVTKVLDLSHHEEQGRYLEGTGSIVFDHPARRAYACVSHRTDPGVLEELCKEIGYTAVTVTAVDAMGRPIYHTNVFLAIGTGWVVVCLEAVQGEGRKRLAEVLGKKGGRVVVTVTQKQVECLAANCYEVLGADGRGKLVMSTTAWSSLEEGQREQLKKADVDLVLCSIPTIERVGGGGIRCMLAPVFNIKKTA